MVLLRMATAFVILFFYINAYILYINPTQIRVKPMKVKRLDNIKASISDVLELPKDVMLNLPKINIVGNNQMYVENHRGIIEYTSQRIRINSTIGIIRILGNSMVIKNIEKNEIVITGYFLTMEFTQ